MKNNNVNWMFLIAVALVVAVVASVISAGITGNVIKVKQDKGGKFNVYTKVEIDSLLKNIKTESIEMNDDSDNNIITLNNTIRFSKKNEFIGGIGSVNIGDGNKIGIQINRSWPLAISENQVDVSRGLLIGGSLSLDGTGIYNEINKNIVISPGKDLLITASNVKISTLSGQGNAYACINSNGTIYRSLTTCI